MNGPVSIDINALVPLRSTGSPNGPASRFHERAWKAQLSRRNVLRAAVVGATALGASALGVFSPAREALAEGYDIASTCNGLGYGDCTSCCCSTVCSGCCDGSGYHKGSYPYALRIDECHAGSGDGEMDGWIWWVCQCSTGRKKHRCHDGWTYSSSGSLKTICNKYYGCA